MFLEKDEVLSLINSVEEVYGNPGDAERCYENYRKIIDRYQEQPHLLDRHLESLIDACLSIARKASSAQTLPLKHLSLKFLRQIFKVRGPKEVVKRMPHEISDLAPVLTFLENENLDDSSCWESGYVLVMWLSILVINPFHLKLLDGSLEAESGNKLSIAQRLMNVCKKCLVLNNNIGQAAPVLISKLLARPDMLEMYMSSFIDWAVSNLDNKATFGVRIGSFAALSAIFKHAKRQDVLPYGTKVLDAVLASDFARDDTLIRKHGMKLIQRIGTMFMKTVVAPWRYQRGCRSLVNNLKAYNQGDAANAPSQNGDTFKDSAEYEELEQFSSEIESILDKLLEGLKDRDTVVRWSAAKGIGRVTNRLPREYGDEVVESLLQIFSDRESSGAWHGGCLALAELGRRGLLLPERLASVVPVVKKALIYDEIRGNFSVGGHVRDAACYVLWAFARAFEPTVVEPFVHEIATALIIAMVFDREVNCRRAASAAFQENVGRQGNFPHGIEIVTIADYFAIGSRNNAFTKISFEIAKYSEYTRPMIDHLIDLKFNHFDTSVRELTAEALANMVDLDPEYVQEVTLNKLLPVCAEMDNHTSHGAILCVSAVVVALKKVEKLSLSGNNTVDIKNIVPSILYRKFRGSHRGNELMRQALSVHIKSCSQAKLPYHAESKLLTTWQSLLEENLSYMEVNVRTKAADALSAMVAEYYVNNPHRVDLLEEFVVNFAKTLNGTVLITRMGYSIALGKFPLEVTKTAFSTVISELLKCATITPETTAWAEARKDATNALAEILSSPMTKNDTWEDGIPVKSLNLPDLFATFLTGMKDYTTDKRGDVGSWVREASMGAIKVLVLGLHKCDPTGDLNLLPRQLMIKIIGQIGKQCVEKIDNVRVLAGNALTDLLHYSDPPIPTYPRREELVEFFPKDFCTAVNWRATALTFPRFAKVIAYEEFSYDILSGFVISGGSLSDTILKDAHGAINSYLYECETSNKKELLRVGQILLEIFRNNFKVERITVSWMKFVSQLLQSGQFHTLLATDNDSFGEEVIAAVKEELFKSNRVEKLVAGIELLCETLQGSKLLVRSALKRLVVYLCHAYPRIRAVTAQKMFEAFLTYGDNIESSNLDEAMNILSEHRWELNIEVLRPARNQICELLNIPQPVLKNTDSATSISPATSSSSSTTNIARN
ncbi:unnamed protein product [Allacma fusca]|uniref:Tubulin-specific chaperone D n=1 Tax=Allacma fusca TaxID=39272 RepID=A0A8J2NUS1_9HEXA|nr:unnamed protein product [Allacma fusca]